MAVSMNFIWRSSSENCSERILPSSNFLLKNSSIVKQFFCQLFGSGIIEANVFISKVNIADGSIPIKATS
jgi:hypothetical protein